MRRASHIGVCSLRTSVVREGSGLAESSRAVERAACVCAYLQDVGAAAVTSGAAPVASPWRIAVGAEIIDIPGFGSVIVM